MRYGSCGFRNLAQKLSLLAVMLCGLSIAAAQETVEWRPLFDGKSLQGWREVPFGGRGQVRVENGAIILGKGLTTGIVWTKPFPKTDYEIRLDAARLEGSDFFAGITFPVEDSYATWINGGWGGLLVGLSSINGQDAAENGTNTSKNFEKGRWYALRLRVTRERIQAWIDADEFINVALEGVKIGLRPGEMELCVPLGIASWSTTGAVRKFEYRTLAPSAGLKYQ